VRLINSSMSADVAVQGHFDNITVKPQEASTVGTIVNELATNALKHSFRDASGTIFLSGKRIADSEYEILCTDDAPASAVKTVASDKRVGLGLIILAASVQQLNGTRVATNDDNGYATRICLRLSAAT
jgi:two-component sensor histidine kinase